MLKKCNVCNGSTTEFLRLKDVPPIQNRFLEHETHATQFQKTNVKFFWCENCRHISIHKDSIVEFDADYNNEQSDSGVAKAHLDRVVENIKALLPDKNSKIVEIGCGRGDLLNSLLQEGYVNLKGYDPVAETSSSLIESRYWVGSDTADIDLLILRHTLEEIPALNDFIELISKSLKPSGRVYIEFTNASKLVSDLDPFSIYPECTNIFSVGSISLLLRRYGFELEIVQEYFRGSWLGLWVNKFSEFTETAGWMRNIERIKNNILALPKPIVLWGAGGRGGNLLSFCHIDTTLIPYVVDVNKAKQGLFIPPYGQKVISPTELATMPVGCVLIASNKYRAEITPHLPIDCMIFSLDELSHLSVEEGLITMPQVN